VLIYLLYSLSESDTYVAIFDTGHINIESQIADKTLLKQFDSENSGNSQDMEDDTQNFENLMYDKFNLELSETTIFIGTDVEECLHQMNYEESKYKGKENRLMQPIDMNLLLEKCILPGNTEFTKIKASAHLPLLSVNFSDQKYKALMNIIDYIIPTNDDGQEKKIQNAVIKNKTLNQSSPRGNTNSGSSKNIIVEHFWGDLYDQGCLSDSSSGASSIHDINTSTVSKSDINIDPSTTEQFKLSFQVDKVLASVIRSSSSSNQGDKGTLLCQLVLEDFELIVLTRPTDLLVDVSLRALNVIDKMDKTSRYAYLLTSNMIDDGCQTEIQSKNLVYVKYRSAQKENPHFVDVYDGYDQTVDVTMSTLTVIVTRSSILEIYNWILETFTSPQPNNEEQMSLLKDDESKQKRRSRRFTKLAEDLKYSARNSIIMVERNNISKNENDKRMKVILHMDSIRLILNDNGTKLSTGELSHGNITILMDPNSLEVEGKLRNFTLSDDVSSLETIESTSQKKTAPIYIISIDGDELADFVYKTYDPLTATFPGYHQLLKLNMGAVKVVLSDALKSTMDFLTQFLIMKVVYDAARNAAIENAQNNQNNQNRFHFDIQIKSPVVILPGSTEDSLDLTAHLGEIRARNEFKKLVRVEEIPNFKQVDINQISCGLFNISLHSTNTSNGFTSSITDDLSIALEIELIEETGVFIGPSIQIRGDISEFYITMTEKQYKSLLSGWDYIQRTFIFQQQQVSPSKENNREDSVSPLHEENQTSLIVVTPISQDKAHLYDQDCSSQPNRLNLDLYIGLNMVSLDIFTGEDDHEIRADTNSGIGRSEKSKNRTNKKKDLSRLSFKKVYYQLQQLSDGSMDMELSVRDIVFEDTRKYSSSKFKDILPASQLNGPQFQLKLATYRLDNEVNVTDLSFTVDSPTIVLSISYLHLLKDFFIGPFMEVTPTVAASIKESTANKDHIQHDGTQSSIQSAKIQAKETTPNSKLIYKINVVDLEVICIESTDEKDSEAIILTLKQLLLEQDENSLLSMTLSSANMSFCRMNYRKESATSFVEEFGATLEIKQAASASVNEPVMTNTSIDLAVQPMVFRLSYYDFILIGRIASKASKLINGPEHDDPGKNTYLNETLLNDQGSVVHDTPTGSYIGPSSMYGSSDEKNPIGLLSKETVRLYKYLTSTKTLIPIFFFFLCFGL
jgi:vacuolar protein sorting-associated protein 13A/C